MLPDEIWLSDLDNWPIEDLKELKKEITDIILSKLDLTK